MKKFQILVCFHLILSGALLFFITSCAVDPISGERQIMLMSESDEIRLGRRADRKVVWGYGIYDDPGLAAYCNHMFQKMARLSHRPNLDYQFTILDSPVVNAFSAPGGYVYFTRGILAYLNSEAELATILGHELGHITARHSAERYSRAKLAQFGLGAGMIFPKTFGDFPETGRLGSQLLFLHFSRKNEREADNLGVEYATRAGYDASKLAAFFETLEKMESNPQKSGLPDWFSTHPNPEDRQETVRRKAVEWRNKLGLTDFKVNRNTYLQKLDGLLFGENPREGFVKNSVFCHPELAFRFPVPSQWDLQNTHSMVRMVNARKNAAIVFNITRRESPREAALSFARDSGVTAIDSSSRQVNGFPAHRLLSRIHAQQGTINLLSCFIQKEGLTYVFHGITSEKLFATYRPIFLTVMNGFSALAEQDKISIRPARIRIRSAPATGNLRDILIKLGVSRYSLAKLAVLNGKNLNDTITAGTLIKVIDQ